MTARFIREMREGERWIKLSDGRLMIVHPERAPLVIDVDGVEGESGEKRPVIAPPIHTWTWDDIVWNEPDALTLAPKL